MNPVYSAHLQQEQLATVSSGENQVSEPFLSAASFIDDIRPFLYQWQQQHLKTAILTLVNIEGSSPRSAGSQMVVNEQGVSVGLISGGCVEKALVAEALNSVSSGRSRLVRYGKESDFFDIKLPCGSGIDVLITPNPPGHFIKTLYQCYVERQKVVWNINLHNPDFTVGRSDQILPDQRVICGNGQFSRETIEKGMTEKKDLIYSKAYKPRHRVVVVGQGAIFDYFLSMASLFDIDLIACSAGAGVPSSLKDRKNVNCQYQILTSPEKFDSSLLDAESSLILLSHEHEWEVPILLSALHSPVPHIAALGSRRTHQTRIELLREAGASDEECERIEGPAGIDIGGFTPPEIALSVLAEVVAKSNAKQ